MAYFEEVMVDVAIKAKIMNAAMWDYLAAHDPKTSLDLMSFFMRCQGSR